MVMTRHPGHQRTLRRKNRVADLIASGMNVHEAIADSEVGVTYSAYQKWRQHDKPFAVRIDGLRSAVSRRDGSAWNGSDADFAMTYFGMEYAPFHLEYLAAVKEMELGDILLGLMPPEHGKTTMFENHASQKLGLLPQWRFCVAAEGITISRRIVSRVRARMEKNSPYLAYKADFGPFRPPGGGADQSSQVWSSSMFNVWKKLEGDERDYNMMAIGRKASIVSTRTDHLHVDDVQSLKTKTETHDIMEWFRQDALSRPGERGITTIAGTRVHHADFYRMLMDDPDLGPFIRIIRFPALRTDASTGEQHWLWPQRYTERNYERMKIKAGAEAWARNYMQQDGDAESERTFTIDMVDGCKAADISLTHPVPEGANVICGVDPALGSFNVTIGCEATPTGKLIVRRLYEHTGFVRNEQIMQALINCVVSVNASGARVTDVVWEAKNFQAGLARDERLVEAAEHYGFRNHEHMTNSNKYDPDIGISSMAESFRRGDIILPWAPDDMTRALIGELRKQLLDWKPGEGVSGNARRNRGTGLKQDMVMALWFVWILWQSRRRRPARQLDGTGWKREASPLRSTPSGILLPTGVRW